LFQEKPHGETENWLGRAEFKFATGALRDGRFMRAFCLVTALSCFALAGLGIIVQFNPAGPTGVASRSVHAAAVISGAVIGCRWLRRPWPRYEVAVAFVAWADITVAAVAATMSTTEARLSTTLYLGVTGVFVGFLLGARLLAVHCAFGAMVIGGITGWAVLVRHASLWGLFTIYMPALMWVVLVPLTGCVLIESGRRAVAGVARSAHRDQLTGLRNRRGMHAAVRRVLAGKTPQADLVVAVCDIDRFKRLNDEDGHAAGDVALIAMAERLRSIVRAGEIAARLGGDELVLVTLIDDPGGMSALLDRLDVLTRIDVGGRELSVSVGVASMAATEPHFSLDDVIRHADAAMYGVKRSGGGACALHRRETDGTVQPT
jgi:diguanylate cyclase (GGDEF)-like protein